jgi:hypothetical protein
VPAERARGESALDQYAAFEVAFEAGAGEVGAADQRDAVVDDEDLGVHGRTWRPAVGGPVKPAGAQAWEGFVGPVEAGIVGGPLEEQCELDTSVDRGFECSANVDAGEGGVAGQQDVLFRLVDQVGEYCEGEASAGSAAVGSGPDRGDVRLVLLVSRRVVSMPAV